MSKNILTQASKLLIIDYIAEVLFFPVWWYGPGLRQALENFASGLVEANRFTGLTLLLKNLFKPMFAQYDKQGRIISFFMRLVLIFYKGLTFVVMVVFYFLILVFWLILPIAVVWGVTYNLPALWLK